MPPLEILRRHLRVSFGRGGNKRTSQRMHFGVWCAPLQHGFSFLSPFKTPFSFLAGEPRVRCVTSAVPHGLANGYRKVATARVWRSSLQWFKLLRRRPARDYYASRRPPATTSSRRARVLHPLTPSKGIVNPTSIRVRLLVDCCAGLDLDAARLTWEQ